jgi:hypothetical protein
MIFKTIGYVWTIEKQIPDFLEKLGMWVFRSAQTETIAGYTTSKVSFQDASHDATF